MSDPIPYLFREPRSTPESRGGRPPAPRREQRGGMVIEWDTPVTTRSGRVVRADTYRPADPAAAVPPLIAWSPYGKHNPAPIGVIYPDSGVDPEWIGPLTTFEAPDPDYWVPRGYAIVVADIPGTWHSTGPATYCSPEEAEDFADLIEWAGTQEWSNGKVGLSGVSYLTVAQWRVAELAPPHLAAINPWEGWSDTYREVARHGGIPETQFWPYIWERWGASTGPIEDLEAETSQHPFFDDFWRSKASQLERVQAPAWVVGSWSDQGLHTRGTLEGYRRISSAQKWLDVHGGKKWAEYYRPENVEQQRRFFDRYLKDIDNGWEERPRVRLELRERHGEGSVLEAEEWPPARTRPLSLFLTAAGGLTGQAEEAPGIVEYDALGNGIRPRRAEFVHTFDQRTVLAGHTVAELMVSAPDADDMDLFLGLFKRDASGEPVGMTYYAQFEDGPVALGWLRVTHRELDPELSLPHLPVLAHKRALPLEHAGTSVVVEILPSATVFEPGESLVLVVQGRDLYDFPHRVHTQHDDTVNRGRHRIHTGGEKPSTLTLPLLS